MANKKRRSGGLGGTPEEHYKVRTKAMRSAREFAALAKEALAEGSCRRAMKSVFLMEASSSRALTHMAHAGSIASQKARRQFKGIRAETARVRDDVVVACVADRPLRK